MKDPFSKCHPAVNFLFFAGAIGFGMVFQHPAYLLAGWLAALLYHCLLHGKKTLKTLLYLIPVFLIVTLINPLLNTQGTHTLFYVFEKPYTLEALLYGGAVAAILLVVLLWFGCYNTVLTSDKFMCLFGSRIPALSLLLVMILRLVPNFIQKANQIIGVRRSIGKGFSKNGVKAQLAEGMTVLSALTSWALEGSIVTADSMRSRGYGCAKRTSFQIYTMKKTDWLILSLLLLLAAGVLVTAFTGGVDAQYTPQLQFAPLSGWQGAGFAAYCIYLLIPPFLFIKEALLWHITRSKI